MASLLRFLYPAKLVLFLLLVSAPRVPAPVPRCSPFLIINKVVEFNSLMSDNNPYFPVPPCEYGGPLEAIKAGDFKAVSVLAEPLKIPRHNFYELIWLLKTGAARLGRVLSGEESIITDMNILREGYQHYTPYVRTHQLGHGTRRRPEIIDNKSIYNKVVGGKIRSLKREGPDRFPTNYTPTGPLYAKRKSSSGLPYQLTPAIPQKQSQPRQDTNRRPKARQQRPQYHQTQPNQHLRQARQFRPSQKTGASPWRPKHQTIQSQTNSGFSGR